MTEEPRHDLSNSTWRNLGLLGGLVAVVALAVLLASGRVDLGRLAGNVAALRLAMHASPLPLDRAALREAMPEATSGVQARAWAAVLAEMGEYSAAEAMLATGLGDSASADLTQFQLCRLYWDIGLRSQALQACQGSVASSGYWLGAGIRALDGGDPAEALKLFEMAAYISPDSAEGWRRYGQTLLASGRPEEAVAALERVLFLNQSPTADVYSALANAYLQLDNLTMARDVLNVGLLNFPDDRDYYWTMAETFLAQDDAKTADSWYVRMLQRWPYDAGVWAARGELALDEGRVADAVKYYEQAATNSPNGFGHWMNLASAAALANDAATVARATNKALELRPDDPGAWLQAGRLLAETGQGEAATAAFEQVLVLQPDNLEAVGELEAQADTASP